MKWIIMLGFALFVCVVATHFAPGVNSQAFNVGSVGITWVMLLFVGACVLVLRAKR